MTSVVVVNELAAESMVVPEDAVELAVEMLRRPGRAEVITILPFTVDSCRADTTDEASAAPSPVVSALEAPTEPSTTSVFPLLALHALPVVVAAPRGSPRSVPPF